MLIISGAVYGSHSFLRCTIVLTFLDSPKSQSFTREKSERKTRILSSFTSRWQISLLNIKSNEKNLVIRWKVSIWTLKGFHCHYFKCIYSRAAAICLATRLEWSSPMPLSETFDVKSPKSHKEKKTLLVWIQNRRLYGEALLPSGAYSCVKT